MTSDNPFVYGEIVTAGAFADREVERDRLSRDLAAGPEGLPHLAAPLRQVLAHPRCHARPRRASASSPSK